MKTTNRLLLKEVMLSRVDTTEPDKCWNWQHTKFRRGYGRIYVDGKSKKAHRISYELFVGPIPDGMLIRHRCNNTSCINPAHLIPGTHKQNAEDRANSGRNALQTGSNNNAVVLTIEQVKLIKQLLSDNVPNIEIARTLDVKIFHVANIKYGRAWKDVN